MVYICPLPIARCRCTKNQCGMETPPPTTEVSGEEKKKVSAKAKMKKMARHLDLFSFFCADISLYMVFDLTIIRCNTM